MAAEHTNVYRVITETLWARVPILDDGSGPDEPYAIAELVVAETPARAKWMAWKADRDSYTGDPRDMPKFAVKCVRKGIFLPAGIATDRHEFRDLWDDPEPGEVRLSACRDLVPVGDYRRNEYGY